MNKQFQCDFINELYAGRSFNERFIIYDKYVKKLGFEAVAYSLMPRMQLESCFKVDLVFHCSDSFSTDFLDHYTTEQLIQDDFTVRRICNNILLPMDWREYELTKQLRPKEESLIKLAREDYGINNGLSIPTMNNEAGFSGASIVSSEKDASFKKLKRENADALAFITHRFHESNFKSSKLPREFVTPFLERLTPNEFGILSHLASGQHFQKIENSIKIASYKVASNALRNLINNKFNSITKERLMYLCGQIDLLDYVKW